MWHAVLVGAGLGSECREKWLCTWVRCFLDKVERSWSCWRHPNASGVGLKVAGAMETVEPHKAQSDFLEGGCGTVGAGRHGPTSRSLM